MSHNTGSGFLGKQFRTCPRCSELISIGAPVCRFCGTRFSTDQTDNNGRNGHITHDYTTGDSSTAQTTDPGPTTPHTPGPCYTSDGYCIPMEYRAGFNPDNFCWPAFWFADLWHAEKGLLQQAIKHFWIRSMVNIIGILALITLGGISSGDSGGSRDTALLSVGTALVIIWFAGVAGSAAIAYRDARTAHRNYLHFFNSLLRTSGFKPARERGLGLYWKFLYIPFAIYLVAFLIMLIAV